MNQLFAVAVLAVLVLPVAAAEKVHDDALLRVYLPKKGVEGLSVVVVCPGLDAKGQFNARIEGENVAQALLRREVAAAVLKCRVADDQKSVSFEDAKNAVKLLRAKALEWGIDPERIGILGFGEGGAVAADLSVNPEGDARVAFTGLVYPTAAVTAGIDEKTPGAFVVHSTRDTVASVEISRQYVAALRQVNRPARYLELESGDHGFDGGKAREWNLWQEDFCEWLTQSGWSTKRLGWRRPMDRVIRGRELYAASVTTNTEGHVLVDFGKHGFGWIEVEDVAAGDYEFIWGDLARDGKIVRGQRGSCLRWSRTAGRLEGKGGFFRVPYVNGKDSGSRYGADAAKTNGGPVWFGEVMPFRWLEVVKAPFPITDRNVRQVPVYYPYDMTEERFDCDSSALVKVHDFCKHSVRATSFAGYFLDGDRERTAYEADAYITALSSYAMSSDDTPAFATILDLQWNPTWPTEWKQFFIRAVYEQWMHSGNKSLVFEQYQRMKHTKSWRHLRNADGLVISDGPGRMPATDGCGTADLVDWPPSFRDGFVMRPINSLVNAIHYRNLRELAEMAKAVELDADAKMFTAEADQTYASYQTAFFDEKQGRYVDGVGTDHTTVQANAMAIACGVVPEKNLKRVGDYVAEKGFSCTTYMAQFVLEALFLSGHADRAFELMTAKGERSWLNMMAQGATITTELWDITDKQFGIDMNHAWSTAPLNMISRYVLGVKPLEAGYGKVEVKPNFGPLMRVSAVVPTPKGGITIDYKNGKLSVKKPVGME